MNSSAGYRGHLRYNPDSVAEGGSESGDLFQIASNSHVRLNNRTSRILSRKQARGIVSGSSSGGEVSDPDDYLKREF